MIQLLKNIFGLGPKVDFKALYTQGAQIIDVRTKSEYQQGAIKGSTHIPLNTLSQQLSKLNKEKTYIVCCASGMRSAQAKGIMQSNGFDKVHNGGGWMSLHHKIQ